jgi:DNA polymerase III alpha subunit
MINLALRTEYSFKNCFGPIKAIAEGQSVVGIADVNNTFGHVAFEQICIKAFAKPVFGVRLMVVDGDLDEKIKRHGPVYIFLAKNDDGLSEINDLVKQAYDNFYYHPRINKTILKRVSENVFVITDNFTSPDRVDYIALTTTTPKAVAEWDLPKVAINFNFYPTAADREVYQLLAGSRNGKPMFENQTYPQYILGDDEWSRLWPDNPEALDNTKKIADACNASLKKSGMIKYNGKINLKSLCRMGARRRGIDLEGTVYGDRLDSELKLIEEKEYTDYFLIVAEMVRDAKKKMFVGPSRGSSAGSLVCYLINITEVDPIEFGLLFERFIDINRHDLPDIDVDFPDTKRKLVIKDLAKKHGKDNVAHIATISRLKPKSAIGEFAMELGIPAYETDAVKDAIIERSGGDARAAMCVADTFETTEVGKAFIQQYPAMKLVSRIESHARHAGVHAAGILVSNDPITKYVGVNTRDNVAMMDGKDAEYINLLKIDVLGLRTLAILEEVADMIGMSYSDYYKLPLDDKKTLDIFNDMRLSGIFQFQGYALQSTTREMGVHDFNDIVVITALARPGPLHSGGTQLYISRKIGETPVEYLSDDPAVVRNTKETLGIIIYQEQLMMIGKDYGGLSWKDVSALRRAASKSLGEEFFGKYKDAFLKGTRSRGIKDEEAVSVWENMVTFGSWGFNKSHAVSYAMISYWTAWAKANHPLEFAVANMNHAKSEGDAVKLLRDMVENDGIEYTAFDPDESVAKWTVKDGKMLGGLLSIPGIGPKKAADIIKRRNGAKNFTPSMVEKLMNPNTVFEILFPCRHFWGDIYENPKRHGLNKAPVMLRDITEPGTYVFIGRLVDRNLRDLNEYQSVVKRGGTIITDHTLFLNLTVEDDTDSIICTIDRYKYQEIGRVIAETGKIDKDWYLIKGKIRDKWRRISVQEIMKLEVGKHGCRPDNTV